MSGPEEEQLREDLGKCTLDASWMYTLVGAMASVPLGIYFKSANPVVYCALGGTALDVLNSQRACRDKRQALEDFLARQKEGDAGGSGAGAGGTGD